jgi:hypothetical protein
MAIRNIKELINNKGYTINPNDRKIFEEGDLQSFFGFSESDAIEFIIYDINDNQLPQGDGSLVRYIPLNSQNINDYFLIQDGTLFQKYKLPSEYFIDAERLLGEAGYANGIFKTQITLINKRAGSQKEYDKLWINEISPSRTEVRLYPLKEGVSINPELQERFNIFVDGKDFREDTIAYALEFVEKTSVYYSFTYLVNKYGNAWVDELISEFKIKDFEVFLNNIYEKFRQAIIFEFTNRISKIDDINFGKPKPKKPPIALSKDEIVIICKQLLTYIVNYYLPQQNIKTRTTTVDSFQASVDEVRDILQSSESDVMIIPKQVELQVKTVTKPDITGIAASVERLIRKEIEKPIKTIITPIEEPIYVSPIKTEEIIYSAPITPSIGGGGGGAGNVIRTVVGGYDPYSGTYSGNSNNVDYLGTEQR